MQNTGKAAEDRKAKLQKEMVDIEKWMDTKP